MAIEPEVTPKTRNTTRVIPRREETIMDLLTKFSWDEAGASAVEYALLLAFIAVAIVSSVVTFGASVKGLFDKPVAKWPGG
jgi:pilus assembly protein Flp/PilA